MIGLRPALCSFGEAYMYERYLLVSYPPRLFRGRFERSTVAGGKAIAGPDVLRTEPYLEPDAFSVI